MTCSFLLKQKPFPSFRERDENNSLLLLHRERDGFFCLFLVFKRAKNESLDPDWIFRDCADMDKLTEIAFVHNQYVILKREMR